MFEILVAVDSVDREAVRRAWELAADDLGLDLELQVSLPETGRHFEAVAVVRGFGGPDGTLILLPQDPLDARRLAEQEGYFVSVLFNSYEQYVRDEFVETLNDWQWFGDGEPPPWYTGKPWSS